MPRIALVLVSLVVLAVPAAAQDAPAPTVHPAPPAPSAPAPVLPRRPLNPLAARIATLVEQQREAIADLEAQFRNAGDETAALAIVRRIEQVKKDAEVAVLRIQADHARQSGRHEIARMLDAAIVALQAPPPVAEPAPRPAPAVTR